MSPSQKSMKHLKKWLEKLERAKDETSKGALEMLKKYDYKCVICKKVLTFEEVKEHLIKHGDIFELVSPNPSSRK